VKTATSMGFDESRINAHIAEYMLRGTGAFRTTYLLRRKHRCILPFFISFASTTCAASLHSCRNACFAVISIISVAVSGDSNRMNMAAGDAVDVRVNRRVALDGAVGRGKRNICWRRASVW